MNRTVIALVFLAIIGIAFVIAALVVVAVAGKSDEAMKEVMDEESRQSAVGSRKSLIVK